MEDNNSHKSPFVWKKGTEEEEEKLRSVFVQWLLENGARYPKIDWPSSNTESGIRGGIATETIATNECMVEIPIHLMMTPVNAYNDPRIGALLRSVKDIIFGDLLLCIYIMHEMRKGPDSFYYPFLKTWPEPGNISEWTNDDLMLLHDSQLLLRSRSRRQVIKNMYEKSVNMLSRLFPFEFPEEEFPFENFKFAWNSLQARAFGRRLPWTAMVPFADCLNHSNVQTKYDYNIDNNGLFRLFPSGVNHYVKGSEVFNSYGRRPNDNLLMDYGFALLDNMWDEVEISLTLPEDDPHYKLRFNALFLLGSHTNITFRLVPNELPFQALMFLRVTCMDPDLLQKAMAVSFSSQTQQLQQPPQQQPQKKSMSLLLAPAPAVEGGERSVPSPTPPAAPAPAGVVENSTTGSNAAAVVSSSSTSGVACGVGSDDSSSRESNTRSVSFLEPGATTATSGSSAVDTSATNDANSAIPPTATVATTAAAMTNAALLSSSSSISDITASNARRMSVGERYNLRADAVLLFERIFTNELEVEVYSLLRGVLLNTLAAYPSSIRQDECALKILASSREQQNSSSQSPAVGIAAPASSSSTALGAADEEKEEEEEEEEEGNQDVLLVAAQDEAQLRLLSPESDAYWKNVNAITYRLTRKRILARTISLLDQMRAYFQCCVASTAPAESMSVDDYRDLWRCFVDIPIGSYDFSSEDSQVADRACSVPVTVPTPGAAAAAATASSTGSTAASEKEAAAVNGPMQGQQQEEEDQDIDDGSRPPSRGYLRRFNTYLQDALVPMQRPKL